MPFFETMMGAMAGYGMKAFLVCQSLNHLNKAYGRDNVILDNCQLVSVFGAVDPETAKRIAEMAGELWEERESSTEHSPKPILGPSRRSQTRREERRPLLVPGQVRALSPREALIFVAGAKPLRAQRLHFDREKRLRERLLPARAGSAPLTTSHDWSGVRAIAPAKASARARRRALLSARTDAQASLFNHQARQERLEAANRAAASLNQPEALPAHVRSKGI